MLFICYPQTHRRNDGDLLNSLDRRYQNLVGATARPGLCRRAFSVWPARSHLHVFIPADHFFFAGGNPAKTSNFRLITEPDN
jgi:hypothetical protein